MKISLFTKSFGFLFLLCCISFASISQSSTIDSLEHWVAKYQKKDTVWIANLIKLEKQYINNRSDKKGKLGFTIVEVSKKFNYKNGISKGLRILSYQYLDAGNYLKSLNLAQERLTFVEKDNNIVDIIDTYNMLISIYASSDNNLKKSLDYALLAKVKLEDLPHSHPEWFVLFSNVYSSLGNLYSLLGQHDKAIQTYTEVLANIQKIGKRDKSLSAKAHYLEGVAYNNMAFAYYASNKFALAATYAEKALALSKEDNNTLLLPPVLNILVLSYTNIGKYDDAERYLKMVGDLEKNHSLQNDEISSYYQVASDLYIRKKDFEKAYYFQNKYITLKDSTQGKEIQNQLNDVNVKYETEKKEQQNKLLNAQNKQISIQNTLYLLSIGFGSLLLLGGIFFYWQLRKKNEALDTLNQIKDRLFAIIAHDLKRPANAFQNLVHVFQFLIKKKQFEKLDEIGIQAESIATDMNLVLDNLFRWGLSQQGKSNVNAQQIDLTPIINDVQTEFKPIATLKEINFEVNCPENSSVFADKTIFVSILRNLLSNAFKFTNKGGKVVLDIKHEAKTIQIAINDTGIGIPKNIQDKLFELDTSKSRKGTNGEQGSGLGLLLCKELIELNNGKISILSKENVGTHVAITFNP